MCDFFWQRVDATDQGDLADIVRATGVPCPSSSDPPTATFADSWQLQNEQSQAAFPALEADDFSSSTSLLGNLRDPLLHQLDGTGGGFFKGSVTDTSDSLFSRVLQISPGSINPPTSHQVMHIPSPRTSGIKRRKSQAKKVVCIPAPAAASNRPSGEVVPSDLWAWRKYGQKPIKGSPYPRGYYRCSSSKGCSARKQVERSRTDPNMLVITYTSEHNHPWPTQRNALAGSTRSPPVKKTKEEPKETASVAAATSSSVAVVKEEMVVDTAIDTMFDNENAVGEFHRSDDLFFADFKELIDEKPGNNGDGAVDSFLDMFDWGGSSFGDQERFIKRP